MEGSVSLAIVLLVICNVTSGIPVTRNWTQIFNAIPEDCGNSPLFDVSTTERIVGGNTVVHGRYPFMVSVLEEDDGVFEHVCGGAIFNNKYVVTAAHCVLSFYDQSSYQVVVGLNRLNEKSDKNAKVHKVESIKLHEDYKEDPVLYNDIALLRLSKPIKYTSYVQPICLPSTKDDPTGYAKVIGWGHTEEDGEISNHLMEVTVPFVSRKDCFDAYDDDPDDGVDEITSEMICAGIKNKDACQYDSGGPLFQISKDKRYTLVGIVSFGRGCGGKYFPGVYTKVASYTDWISKNTK